MGRASGASSFIIHMGTNSIVFRTMCILASYFNYRFFGDHFLLYASQGRNAAGLDGCNPRRTLEYILAGFEKFHVKYDELRILRTPARQPYKNTRPMAVLLRMAGTQEPD